MKLKFQKFVNKNRLLVSIDNFDLDIKEVVKKDGFHLIIYNCGLVRYEYLKNGEFWSSSLSQIKTIFPEYSFFNAEVSVECNGTIYSGYAFLNTENVQKEIRNLLWQRKGDVAWNMQLCEIIINSYNENHKQFLEKCEELNIKVLSWLYGTYRVGFKKSDLKKFVEFLQEPYIWKWSFQ